MVLFTLSMKTGDVSETLKLSLGLTTRSAARERGPFLITSRGVPPASHAHAHSQTHSADMCSTRCTRDMHTLTGTRRHTLHRPTQHTTANATHTRNLSSHPASPLSSQNAEQCLVAGSVPLFLIFFGMKMDPALPQAAGPALCLTPHHAQEAFREGFVFCAGDSQGEQDPRPRWLERWVPHPPPPSLGAAPALPSPGRGLQGVRPPQR